jgi:hypothetical protein
VRILVLWNAARGVVPGQDRSLARDQARRVAACPGVAALGLHPMTSAAVPDSKPCGWCLELRLAQGHEPSEVIGAAVFVEFIGDMRVLGMRPQLLAIDGELP